MRPSPLSRGSVCLSYTVWMLRYIVRDCCSKCRTTEPFMLYVDLLFIPFTYQEQCRLLCQAAQTASQALFIAFLGLLLLTQNTQHHHPNKVSWGIEPLLCLGPVNDYTSCLVSPGSRAPWQGPCSSISQKDNYANLLHPWGHCGTTVCSNYNQLPTSFKKRKEERHTILHTCPALAYLLHCKL